MQLRKTEKILLVGLVYYTSIIFVGWFLFKTGNVSVEIIQMVYALVFFLILPILLIKKGFRKDAREFNWPVKYVKRQLIFSVSTVIGISLLFWIFMLQWGGSEVSKKMIWWNRGMISLAWKNLIILPIGLLAQEFFFRGFLLKLLQKVVGGWRAVLVSSTLFGLFTIAISKHWLGWSVLGGIILFNVLLGWVVIKFRSVVFSFWLYWLGTVGLTLFALWQIKI